MPDGFQHAEQQRLQRRPAYEAHENSTTCVNDQRRQAHQVIHERLELHPQHAVLFHALLGLFVIRTGRRWPQRQPRFEVPRQAGHYHVGPIAQQRVDGRGQRTDATLQLRVQVFLIASIVRREHDLFGRRHTVVRDIEEVAIVGEQLSLAVAAFEILPHYNQRPIDRDAWSA